MSTSGDERSPKLFSYNHGEEDRLKAIGITGHDLALYRLRVLKILFINSGEEIFSKRVEKYSETIAGLTCDEIGLLIHEIFYILQDGKKMFAIEINSHDDKPTIMEKVAKALCDVKCKKTDCELHPLNKNAKT
jgi:hypothetical protein